MVRPSEEGPGSGVTPGAAVRRALRARTEIGLLDVRPEGPFAQGHPLFAASFPAAQHPWIVGLDRAESRELLSIANDQYRKPEFQVRFSWQPGSVAFWDNRAAVHYAVRNYGDFPRLLERILIADEPQYAGL